MMFHRMAPFFFFSEKRAIQYILKWKVSSSHFLYMVPILAKCLKAIKGLTNLYSIDRHWFRIRRHFI